MPGIEQNVEEFLASLEDDVRQASERLQHDTREKAPSFRAFALLDPKEVVQTRVIAALLNPFGTHGQHDAFLRLFLEHVKRIAPQESLIDFEGILSRDDLRETEVIREHLTRTIESDRRIDLVVRLPQNNIVAIESKACGAKDQKEQLQDYWKELENIADCFLLIYLSSGDAHAAEEVARLCEKQSRTVVQVPYRKFIPSWLDECERNCCAEPVQQFLSDFKKYLSEEEVPMDKMEMERIVEVATQDEGKLRSALAVIDAQGKIGKKLARRFIEQLESKIRSRLIGEWELKCDFSTDSNYPKLILKSKHWGRMSVAFEFRCETAWPEDIGFGIMGAGKRNAADHPPFNEEKMRNLESKHLLNGCKTPAWRCFKVWRPREERREDTAVLLFDPPDAVLNDLAGRLVQLAEDLNVVLRG